MNLNFISWDSEENNAVIHGGLRLKERGRGQGGGKACVLQAAATGPHTLLAEADAPKTQKAAAFVLGGGTPPRLPAPWAGLCWVPVGGQRWGRPRFWGS